LRILGDERMMTDITVVSGILLCNAVSVNFGSLILTFEANKE